MGVIIDLIAVTIIVVTIWLSYRRGFIRTFIEVVGYIAAVFIAIWLAGIVANFIYDSFVCSAITKTLQNLITDQGERSANAIISELPSFLPIDKSQLTTTIDANIGSNAAGLAKTLANGYIKAIIVPVIQMIAAVILFIILAIVVKILAKQINRLFNIPIIGTVNRVLGGFVGVFKGFIMSFIFCLIINAFNVVSPDKTILYKFMCSISPF